MSVKQRLLEYIDYLKISNSEFCRSINVSTAFISSMRKSMQPDKLESIALKYPDLNIDWLLTGVGEMLNKPNINNKKMDAKSYEQLQFELKEANEKISRYEKLIDVLMNKNSGSVSEKRGAV